MAKTEVITLDLNFQGKTQAIASAYEAAKMLLRIDDMIASKGKPAGAGGMPPGGMGGMGGDY